MELLKFSELDENLFQAVVVCSTTKTSSTAEWLKRIIDNSNDKNLEFKPVLDNGKKLLKIDLNNYDHIESIRCQNVLLDNKYYTTNVYLVELDDTIQLPDNFYDYIHGIIIYFDNNDPHSLQHVNKWIDYIDDMSNCAIKILSCETATDHNSISRIEIQNFCIENGFELVELVPSVDDDYSPDDLEDDFKESNSFERIYKAIQAYVWPNMNYKEKSGSILTSLNNDVINRINKIHFDGSEDNDTKTPPYKPIDSNNETLSEENVDQFEELFSKFSDVKNKASKLQDDERRRYAEQIAMAFWNSISDDKDEIATFSSDEDQDPNHVYI